MERHPHGNSSEFSSITLSASPQITSIQIIPHLFHSLYMVCTKRICTCLTFVHAFSNRSDSLFAECHYGTVHHISCFLIPPPYLTAQCSCGKHHLLPSLPFFQMWELSFIGSRLAGGHIRKELPKAHDYSQPTGLKFKVLLKNCPLQALEASLLFHLHPNCLSLITLPKLGTTSPFPLKPLRKRGGDIPSSRMVT